MTAFAPSLIPSFMLHDIQTAAVRLRCAVGGSGHPLLLLHGHPQTHATWHKIAPVLARHFTVVAADLRGYGDSEKPSGGERHVNYSKRAIAKDTVLLIRGNQVMDARDDVASTNLCNGAQFEPFPELLRGA